MSTAVNGNSTMDSQTHLSYRVSLFQSIAVIVGIVVGAGIFRTPPLVAMFTGSSAWFLGVWVLGGIISLIGAFCYAELTTAYPHEGGDYLYIGRAFGPVPAFLFVWARMTVIQTGSIAMLAFIIGDYATSILSLGDRSSSLYAAGMVIFLTMINISGVGKGYKTQTILFILSVISLFAVSASGLLTPAAETAQHAGAEQGTLVLGKALIFVLLTYGGWTEAAFISREMVHSPRNMVRSLIISIAIITGLYLLANVAYLRSLGITGIAGADVVGSTVMNKLFGAAGAMIFSAVIIVIAMSTMNGVMITGARSNFALGSDYRVFGKLGILGQKGSNPVNAYLVQGVISLVLVGIGSLSRSGFSTMVDYTAPVFWFFILLTGCSLFALRIREPHTPRPFTVPGYPIIPILFCASSGYLLYSSVAYAGMGGMLGIAILVLGLGVYMVSHKVFGEASRRETLSE
jgi:basic amino acid/polyamine antiporter, APA family